MRSPNLVTILYPCILLFYYQVDGKTSRRVPDSNRIVKDSLQRNLIRKKSGSTLILPCDVVPPDGDRVEIILWYRDRKHEAIYTYDARNASRGTLFQSSHDPTLQSRVTFNPFPPANLTIRDARPSDAGLYQCRVDFMSAPSKTTYLEVRILAPPESMHLEYETRTPISDVVTANLQDNVTILCVVLGGDPRPYIRWSIEGKAVEGTESIIEGMRTQSSITLKALTRNDHGLSILCKASAPNSSKIFSEATTLKINTPPLSVKIHDIPSTLIAGQRIRLFCEVVGAYPTPEVTWTITRGDKQEENLTMFPTGMSNGQWWMEFEPKWIDHGALLSCAAVSSVSPYVMKNDSTIITVHYSPRIFIGLGEHLIPSSIKEGIDVYFKCTITSNPKVYKVTWYHGEEEILQNFSKGMIVSDEHLAIQRITRKWSGEFTCRASNVVGDSSSNKLNITVQFAPVCSDENQGVFEAALGEEVFLPCRVLAYPSTVTFYWTFANTVTQERLSQELVKSKGLESILRYRLENPQDYGTLQCWATNTAGEQRKSCSITLKPAGAPAPPGNCSVSNQTWDTLEVTCFSPKAQLNALYGESLDTLEIFERFGNLSQIAIRRLWRKPRNIRFLLTIYEQRTLKMVHNETGVSGVFLIRGLSPGLDYLITISRYNSRGRSSENTLEAFTLKTAENRMRDEVVAKPPRIKEEESIPSFPAIIIGVSSAGIAAIGILIIIVKRKCRRSREILHAKEPVSLSSLGDPPDLIEQKYGDFSPSTTMTHSSLVHESLPMRDESPVCISSIESAERSSAQTQRPGSSIIQTPIVQQSYITQQYLPYKTEPLIVIPSQPQCQCTRIQPLTVEQAVVTDHLSRFSSSQSDKPINL